MKELLESRPRAITRAMQSLLEDMTLVQRRIQETTRGATLVAFASPPGFVHWGRKPLQMLVYALWEFSKFERRDAREEIIYHFRICAPNLRVHPESLRLGGSGESSILRGDQQIPPKKLLRRGGGKSHEG